MISVIGDGTVSACFCSFAALICGAIADEGDDEPLAVGWLSGAIVVHVASPIGSEIALILLSLFVFFICCCFRAVIFAADGFIVVAVCCVDGDDTADDVCGVAADAIGGFTAFAIPQMFDSVVLTTLRLGLLGSHIFALTSDDIGLLCELLSLSPSDGSDDDKKDGNCCANTWVLLQIAKTSMTTRSENATKIKFV